MKTKQIILIVIGVVSLWSCNTDLSKDQKKEYTKKGKEIAKATMKELGGNLMKQMKLGGTKIAIPFCNATAYPLTDKMADKYRVKIKRTSHKIRNPKNKPNSEEQKVIKSYLASLNKKEKLQPIVQKENDNKVHFYAPIILQKNVWLVTVQ